MRLRIKKCNNIESGEFDIIEGRLNIKYAINGTGKSTIAKAIDVIKRFWKYYNVTCSKNYSYYQLLNNFVRFYIYDVLKNSAIFIRKHMQ